MKDEIKERIKYFKHYVVDNLSLDAQDDFQKILDYITNLQQGYDNAIKQSLADHKYASQKEDEVIELQQENENQAKRNSRQRLANQKQQDLILKLQQIEQEHKKINGELREENSKLEIALQNIQEDYNKRIKEIDVLKEKLDRRYYKNEYERLKELNKNASKVCMAEHRYGVDKAEEARDYRFRCEKAIEYIKEHSTSTYFSMLQADYDMNLDILLNILQNGGENDGD